jgi:DNA-binding LytR/AlgR family response regulator
MIVKARVTANEHALRVLAVDDEAPALADLVFELRSSAGIADVVGVGDATEALRAVRGEKFDAVFLDVRMPGLDGLELARILGEFRVPPAIVFVTAYDEHAVDAFEIAAVDYLLKPVRRERLDAAIRRIRADLIRKIDDPRASSAGENDPLPRTPLTSSPAASTMSPALDGDTQKNAMERAIIGTSARNDDERISVESGGRIRVIDRKNVRYVAASGDYVRLFLADSSVLYRTTTSALEEKWSGHGFVRIHRGYLVNLRFVEEVRVEPGRGYVVFVNGRGLPVSRRLARNLKQRLLEIEPSLLNDERS